MINYFINNSRITLLITLAIILSGVLNLFSIKREALPNVDFAQAIITTYYPGATPEDMETLVTKKIEDALRANSSIKQLTSVSKEGLSEIKLKLSLEVDIQHEMDEIQRTIDRVTELPEDLPEKPNFIEIKTEQIPAFEISVLGDIDYAVLRKTADELEKLIELSDGISKIDKIGYLERELRVYVETNKMSQHHISFNEITQAIKEHNLNVPGGIFESRPIEKSIRIKSSLDTPKQLEDIVVRTNLSGHVVKISDIGRVESTFAEPKVISRTNGKPSIILVIKKDENSDIIKLAKHIKSKIAKFQNQHNVNILINYDGSSKTINRLNIVINNSIIGFILLFFTMLMFLSVRTSLVTSLSIPIIILSTLTIMLWININFNIISMLAIVIALGMFVDNSIVISENIYRFWQEGLPIKQAAIQGTSELYAPIITTVLTTIVAFLPIALTTGIMGQFIWAIPIVVSSSLVISLFESFCLLPTRIVRFNKGAMERKLTWLKLVQNNFVIVLQFLIHNRYKTMITLMLLLISILTLAVFKINFILFPPEGVDRFIIRYSAPTGTPIEDLHASVKKLEDYIIQLPPEEMTAFTTKTGIQQTNPNDPLARKGDNVGMIIVYLTNENKRKRNADTIIKQLRQELPKAAPIDKLQFGKIYNRPPIGRAVTITIKGDDIDTLRTISRNIKNYLSKINGVEDIDSDLEPGFKQLQITLKKDVGANYGLTPQDISFSLRTAFEGIVVSTVRKFTDDIDIRVLFSEKTRGEQHALDNMLISTKQGNLVPLFKVANIMEIDGSATRRHFNHQRSITITADIDLNKTTSSIVNKKLAKKFNNISSDYSGYSLKFGGEEESSQESMSSLGRAMILAFIGIFTILVAMLKSYLKPFLILLTIPFSFTGTIIGFLLHSKPFGFLAMVGLIGLTGVIVNTGIILVATIDNMRKHSKLELNECLINSAKLRLRPVLLTTLTTILALFPTAYGIGGYDPILVPMTLAMAWGLLFGTFLTLIIVPCGYAIMEDFISHSK